MAEPIPAEPSDFATRLRDLRKKRGLRQADLAKALGVAQTTIANYEAKLRFPDERMLGRLADFFGVSFDSLLGRSDGMQGAGAVQDPAAVAPPLSGTAARYLELLRAMRADAALELVESVIQSGQPLERVYLDILAPALRETGTLWERGELSVGEEHTISEATQRIMSRIAPSPGGWVAPSPGGRAAPTPGAWASAGGKTCLALAVSREEHTIGARMVADLLRLDGWDVVFPRGNLSIRHVVEMLESNPPDLVALSVTLSENVAEAETLIAVIREHRALRGVRILVGGQAFLGRPSLWQKVGADATADDAEAAVLMANRIVGRNAAPPA